MLYPIIVSVLVTVAVSGAVLALLTYVRETRSKLNAHCLATDQALKDLSRKLRDVEKQTGESANAHVQTELAALAGDVSALAKTVKKQFGRVWAELQHDGTLDRNEERQADVETPEEIRARLRAQHGLPRVGGAPSLNGEASE